MLRKYRLLTYLLPIQILLVNWLSYYPEFIEKYYSNGIYPYISNFLRFSLSWIPFSVGDILLLYLMFKGLVLIWKLFRYKNRITILFIIGSKLSIIYFIFYLFWGMNYYRNPLQKSMNLTIPKYNIEELTLLTEKLLIKTEEIHFKLTKNDTIPVQTVYSQQEILDKTVKGYDVLSKLYPQFRYHHPEVKKSLFSTPMSYMGFSGYLNPLSGEAQVNYNSLDFKIPAIASHEVAHQIGYANESEANFIGYLAAIHQDDLYFNYSGYLMALQYALGNIYRYDKDLHREIFNRFPIGVKKNIEENYKYWEKYKNPLEPYFHSIYDSYLKANHQKHGIKSYGRMIGLLMAYEQKKEL